MSEQEFITVGKVLSPWGSRGELKIEVITDFPQRFAPAATVFLRHQPVTLEGVQWHKGKAVIKLKDVDTITDAERLAGELIEIEHGQLEPLPEGWYYQFQLTGLEVWTTEGELVGKIIDVLSSPSNDNYIVSGSEGEVLIPAIADVIKSVDLDNGRVVIEPIEGLLNLNKKAAG